MIAGLQQTSIFLKKAHHSSAIFLVINSAQSFTARGCTAGPRCKTLFLRGRLAISDVFTIATVHEQATAYRTLPLQNPCSCSASLRLLLLPLWKQQNKSSPFALDGDGESEGTSMGGVNCTRIAKKLQKPVWVCQKDDLRVEGGARGCLWEGWCALRLATVILKAGWGSTGWPFSIRFWPPRWAREGGGCTTTLLLTLQTRPPLRSSIQVVSASGSALYPCDLWNTSFIDLKRIKDSFEPSLLKKKSFKKLCRLGNFFWSPHFVSNNSFKTAFKYIPFYSQPLLLYL